MVKFPIQPHGGWGGGGRKGKDCGMTFWGGGPGGFGGWRVRPPHDKHSLGSIKSITIISFN